MRSLQTIRFKDTSFKGAFNIILIANEEVERIMKDCKELCIDKDGNERTGGYMVVYSDKGIPLASGKIGLPPSQDCIKYLRNANEKAHRLSINKHCSSFASANEDLERYGGGIRLEHFIVAVSGFPPLTDEFISSIAAYQSDAASLDELQIIGEISKNKTLIAYIQEQKSKTI